MSMFVVRMFPSNSWPFCWTSSKNNWTTPPHSSLAMLGVTCICLLRIEAGHCRWSWHGNLIASFQFLLAKQILKDLCYAVFHLQCISPHSKFSWLEFWPCWRQHCQSHQQNKCSDGTKVGHSWIACQHVFLNSLLLITSNTTLLCSELRPLPLIETRVFAAFFCW